MRMTLQEILDTCPDWIKACNMLGFSEWAVNEGGGHVQVELTTQQAHQLGIVKLPPHKVEKTNSDYNYSNYTEHNKKFGDPLDDTCGDVPLTLSMGTCEVDRG